MEGHVTAAGEEMLKKVLIESLDPVAAHVAFRRMWDALAAVDVEAEVQEIYLAEAVNEFWAAWHALEDALCLEHYE